MWTTPADVACSPSAWGLRDLRPGFAWDDQHDRLFALGFPHLRWLESGLREDDDPEASALEILGRYGATWRLAWPVETARRCVRMMGGPFLSRGGRPSKRGREVLARSGPVEPEEAGAALRFLVTRGGAMRQPAKIVEQVFLLEALVGPEPVARAMVGLLEELPAAAWCKAAGRRATPNDVAEAIQALGFVLLRAPAAATDELLGRLGELHQARAAETPRAMPVARLDAALHGAEGLERSVARLASGERNPRLYALGRGDPGVVRDAAGYTGPLDRSMLDARLVFLGGEAVLDRFAERWPTLRDGERQRFFLETVGQVRSERVVAIVEAMAERSRAKRAAKAWLARRGGVGS